MAKLPPDVHLQIARVTTKDVWEIDELLQVLHTEVEAREISEGVKVHEIRSSTTSFNQYKFTRTAASTMVTRDTGNNVICVYCKESHYSASCTKVSTISARREKEGRCFVCLSRGHRANECHHHRKCRKCGRRHHQSLCETDSTLRIMTPQKLTLLLQLR